MIQGFTDDFEKDIQGMGSEVTTTELSGGAHINSIFHERYPYLIQKVRVRACYELVACACMWCVRHVA